MVVDEKGQEVEVKQGGKNDGDDESDESGIRYQEEHGDEMDLPVPSTTLLKPVYLSKADREALQASKEK